MKIFNVRVYDLPESIKASGYPMSLHIQDNNDSWDCDITTKDLERATTSAHNPLSSGHCNFLSGILVSFDIEMPQYLWMQFERYHFKQIVSSQSKMHRITKMDLDDQCNEYVLPQIKAILKDMINQYNANPSQESFQKIISNTPMGLNLTARINTNYLQLATIRNQRHKHPLIEWHYICDWIDSLPKFKELIL